MADIFRLPAVSPTMEIGTLVAWRVEVGAALKAGDVLAEIGTDKATIEAQIFEDGTLLARLVEVDAEVPVGAPIAVLGQPGEDVTELVASARAELGAAPPASAPAPPDPSTDAPTETVAPAPASTPQAPAPVPAATEPALSRPPARTWAGRTLSPLFMEPAEAQAPASPPPSGRVRASPIARRSAFERGVDLTRIRGTGPGGRIVRSDVEGANVVSGPGPVPAVPADRTTRPSQMRKVIAKRLLASHQGIPVFHLTTSFDVGAWPKLREALKAMEIQVSYNDLLVAAVAQALRASPRVNASWTEGGIVEHGRVDVGLAVALEDGLVTPVIRSADTLSVRNIGASARELAAKAREGKLLPEDYQGGTFTVSNLGMMAIEHFTAVINPPEVAILAAGAVQQVPVVGAAGLTVGWRMSVTLSCDHRVVDGAVGAAFLQVLRRYVEVPALLTV